MKKLHLLIPTILVASSIPMVSMVGCGDKSVVPTGIKITGIDIISGEANVLAGEEIQLGYEFTPSSYKGPVEWASENESYATIDSTTGKLTASSENIGMTTISVKAVGYDNVFDFFWLNVNPYINITGGPEDHKIKVGVPFILDAQIIPIGGSVTWSTLDTEEIELTPDTESNQCTVKGLEPGNYTINVKSVQDPFLVYGQYIITVEER